MWHGDRKWANAMEKNGVGRLAWHRMATNLPFVKRKKGSIYEVQ